MALEDNKEALFLAGALGVSAAMLYKGSQIRKKGEESKISVVQAGGKLIVAKPIQINLPEEALKKASDAQKLALGAKSKAKNNLGRLVRPSIPIRLSDKIPLDNMRKDGLLGRLVAQYYVFENARIFYMTRCGAFNHSDDTPTWLQREKQLITKAEADNKLKSSKWFGVALENKHYLDRWDGGDSKSKLYRRRYSLEATFSNWCAPPWAYVRTNDYGRKHHAGHAGHIGSSFCKPVIHKKPGRLYLPYFKRYDPYYRPENSNDPEIHRVTCKLDKWTLPEECRDGKSYTLVQGATNLFYKGDFPFGVMMLAKERMVISHGYRYPDNVTHGDYSEVCNKDYYALDSIPWRNFKGVSEDDRLKATYKLPIEYDYRLEGERRERIERYYNFGYQIVRTMLDILCAFGIPAEDYPEFAKHCTWWLIPQPNAKFVARYPDLSVIGSGVQGFQQEEIPELIDYVMAITPKPGTIAPWEDKGPLWTWPKITGHLQPLPLPMPVKERKSDDLYGTIIQYILSLETSICANVASGVANAVVNEAIKWAESVCSEWINQGIDAIMEQLDNAFGKTLIGEVKEILKDVSGFAANMSHVITAQNLIGDLTGSMNPGINIAKTLTEYLDSSVMSQYKDVISGAAIDAQSAIDGLRKQWDWADELIGSAGSLGRPIKRALQNVVPR